MKEAEKRRFRGEDSSDFKVLLQPTIWKEVSTLEIKFTVEIQLLIIYFSEEN